MFELKKLKIIAMSILFFAFLLLQSCNSDNFTTLTPMEEIGLDEFTEEHSTTTETEIAFPIAFANEGKIQLDKLLVKKSTGISINPKLRHIEKEVEKSKKTFAGYKQFIDALNALEFLLENERLPPTHPRVFELQIELVQLIAGIHPKYPPVSNQQQGVPEQSIYLPYLIHFSSLKHQIESSGNSEYKGRLIAQCDKLTQKCYRNMNKTFSEEFKEEEKVFLEKQLNKLKAILGS